jgi:hypothetical protein
VGEGGRSEKTHDPETDESTNLPPDLVHSYELTTNGGRGDFGDVERSEVGGGADTETGDDATSVEGTKTGVGAGSKHLQRLGGGVNEMARRP